jgi:molybdenum cofactor biosynthesis enzyme MoaA
MDSFSPECRDAVPRTAPPADGRPATRSRSLPPWLSLGLSLGRSGLSRASGALWRALRRGLGHVLSVGSDPSLHAFLGAAGIETLNRWINNHIMVKQRQQRCRAQQPDDDTKTYLATHFCAHPFTTLETTHTGLAFVCCPVWLPTPIGTLDTDADSLWTGPVAQKIRESIIDGSFRYCDHRNCSFITNRALPHRESPEARAILDAYAAKGTVDRLPSYVTLSHDKSCNLSCPSCRSYVYVAAKPKQRALDRLTETAILPLLRHAERVNITGSGDPFGSNHFRNLIKRLAEPDFAGLRIDLHTNGQLWDERAWTELRLQGRVHYAQISIDAACAETYAIIRRGGSFERLLANLAFVRRLRESGEIAELEFSMVVQARNFREMPAFVALGRSFGADAVSFQMIRKRDIFSALEFEAAFIAAPDHADHQEFLEVLSDPALAAPGVRMGNVLAYVRHDEGRPHA